MSLARPASPSKGSAALLVPCHNGAAFLPRLAASAHAQTRPFDEWRLFDDGSTDETAVVARQLGFTVLRSDRRLGPSAARNALAQATLCEWLHFHDADDLMAADYLACSIEATREGADLVICDMSWVDDQTRQPIFHWRYDQDALRLAPYASLLEQTVGGINALYRRDSFLKAGGFDESRAYWEDLDLSLRLFRTGIRLRVVNRDLVTALRRDTSFSNRNDLKVWTSKLDLMAEWLHIEPAAVAAAVAREAEAIAVRMAGLRELDATARALDLCVQAGGSPPTTRNLLIKAAKWILPPLTVMRLQQWVRRLVSPASASGGGRRP